MDVVRQFVRFVASIDLKSYSPIIFESVNGNALREMSKTSFELFCDMLDGKTSVGEFGPLEKYLYQYRVEDEKIYLIDQIFDVYKEFCLYSELKLVESRQTFNAPFMTRLKCETAKLRRKSISFCDETKRLRFFVF